MIKEVLRRAKLRQDRVEKILMGNAIQAGERPNPARQAAALADIVAPMDGTRSRGIKAFLDLVPERFKEIGYGLKTLPNGNQVVDGRLISWIFKLKSLEKENRCLLFIGI